MELGKSLIYFILFHNITISPMFGTRGLAFIHLREPFFAISPVKSHRANNEYTGF